jgi:hypothetical protein
MDADAVLALRRATAAPVSLGHPASRPERSLDRLHGPPTMNLVDDIPTKEVRRIATEHTPNWR